MIRWLAIKNRMFDGNQESYVRKAYTRNSHISRITIFDQRREKRLQYLQL